MNPNFFFPPPDSIFCPLVCIPPHTHTHHFCVVCVCVCACMFHYPTQNTQLWSHAELLMALLVNKGGGGGGGGGGRGNFLASRARQQNRQQQQQSRPRFPPSARSPRHTIRHFTRGVILWSSGNNQQLP